MKVVEIHSEAESKIKYVEREMPIPGNREVLIKWHATTLNFHDFLVANGSIPVTPGRIPMSDGAGEIVKLGSSIHEWKVGDRVMSLFFPDWQDKLPTKETIKNITGETTDGCMCEYSVVSANAITKIPDTYSYAEAACLPTAGLTAWNGLKELHNIAPGETVLLQGTGGVSTFALNLCRSAAMDIYMTSSSPTKATKLLDLGCEAVLNYKEDEKWGKSIFKLTEGGVDYVLDVGGGSTMVQSIESSKMNGKIISIGILSNGRKGSITWPKIFFKFINITGLAVGNKAMQNRMIAYCDKYGVKPIIDKSFGFEELESAFEYQMGGKQFGKIVLEW